MDVARPSYPYHAFWPGFFLIVLLFFSAIAWAGGPKKHFDIPAGDLGETLLLFSRATGIETMQGGLKGTSHVISSAVVGDFEPLEALARLLEGTGFTFELKGGNTVVIVPIKSSGGSEVRESGQKPRASVSDSRLQAGKEDEMPQVLVTGSLLHGVFDIMSPLVRLTKKKMSEAAYGTVQDALQMLPGNFGGQAENFGSNGNQNRGWAPNLRGLGYGATLVLVDGHRQPAAGTEADFVDVSNIPSSAVQRIEVLSDGASALYGSDAIAGVVNIIMRTDLDGAETQTRYGTAPDGAAERMVAQLFGRQWKTGKWLFDYQYSDRTPLAAADRVYAASEDKTPLGGSDFRTINSNPGNILDPATLRPIFGIPQGQDGRSLNVGDLLPGSINLENEFARQQLLPNKQMQSLFFSGSQRIGERLEISGEARYTQRSMEIQTKPWSQLLVVPKSNPFSIDPFNRLPYTIVAYSFLKDLGVVTDSGQTRSYANTLTLNASINDTWRASFSASYGRENMRSISYNLLDQNALNVALADPDPVTAFNPFGDGSHTNPATLDKIRMTADGMAVSDMTSVSAVADGDVFILPTGSTKLALGASSRTEKLDRKAVSAAGYSRDVKSAFTELSVPLIGSASDPHEIPRLELSLAGRYEHYSDFGSTFNPKIGLRWIPLKSVKLRSSWGGSFKAPRLIDLYDTAQNAAGILVLPDPRSPSGQSIIVGRQGNNPNLKQETATTWTAGVDLAPAMMPGLTLSLTYYSIDYEDRIVQPGLTAPFNILLQENQWADVINRNPSRSQIDEICNDPKYFGSREQCLQTSPAAIIDYRIRNLSATRMRGFDIGVDHSADTRYGRFSFNLDGSYVLEFKQALTKISPGIDTVDTVNNPLALRVRATMGWNQRGPSRQGFGLNISLDHAGSYKDIERQPVRKVDAWTSLGLQTSYRTGESGSWHDSLEFVLNAVNLFNGTPPFVDRAAGYDTVNALPVGRVISFHVQKNWDH